MPPSTRKVDAVMNDESSLARNATAAAISSGSAKRPMGTCTSRRCRAFGVGREQLLEQGRVHRPGAERVHPDALARNEVRLARQITHPAVCRVFDIGEVDDQVFLSMELVQGEDLAAFVHRVGRLPSEKVAEIGRQLCDALAAAHRQGILHRDLKPANVLIDETGSVRITDFGIAVTRGSGHNTGIGTPGYMAPEQLLSGGSVSERTDLYALGLVLYELLVGRRTFSHAASVHHLPPPSTIVDGVDPRLERVVMRALSPDPADRPSSAAGMAAELAVNRRDRHRLARPVLDGRGRHRSLVAIVAVVSPFLARSGGGTIDRTGHDRARRLHEHDRRAGVRRRAESRARRRAGAVAVHQGISRRSGAGRAAPDEPADRSAAVTRSVAREVAQREQLKALLAGSIASLGRNYVIAIEAVNAQSGDVMAREQVEVPEKEQVLASLGRAAARLREKLGESLASIQRFDVPLPRATTSSLEALHSYALALDQDRLVARAGAVPHLKRAIELDPDFALAHALLSGFYANSGRSTLAPEYSPAGVRASRPGQRARAVLHLVALLPRRYAGLGQGLRAGAHLDCDVPPRGVRVQQPRGGVQRARSVRAGDPGARDREPSGPQLRRTSRKPRPDVHRAEPACRRARNRSPGRQPAARPPEPSAIRLPRRVHGGRCADDGARAGVGAPPAGWRRASDWEARTAAFAGRVQIAHERFRRAVEAATLAQLGGNGGAVVRQRCRDACGGRTMRRHAPRNGGRAGPEPRQHHARAQRPRAGAVRGARRRRRSCPTSWRIGFRMRR